MRRLWLIGLLALVGACSSYGVRCNKHLRPINLPNRAASVAEPRGRVSPAPGLHPPGSQPSRSPAATATDAPTGQP
ncbi:MAG: hypothetical protein JWL65_1137 [Gammaproteobacteria bacterium]|nr:hypothetical protein [Gammaproteobacteria bacterium]